MPTKDTINAQLFCHAVGRLLIVDGLLTDEESDFMREILGRFQLNSEQRQEVIDGINISADFDERIAQLSASALKELISLLKEAANVDGHVGGVEEDFIAQFSVLLDAASSSGD